MSVERIIGIDFGTSTSLIKVKTYKDGEPLGDRVSTEYIPFGLSFDSTSPTLVFESDDGKFQCGYDAKRANTSGTLHRNFKLDLLSADAEKRSKAEMLTELFFTYLYGAYNPQTSIFPNCDEETTYVSYPAKWPEKTREFMRCAASKAGFKNVKGIDEPFAVLNSVVVQETTKLQSIGLLNEEDCNILIIDMGAGTTDLALCRYNAHSNNIKPLFAWPRDTTHSLFGGREIDDALCRYTMQVIADHGVNITERIERKFLKESKSWKEKNVSPLLAKGETINYCGYLSEFFDIMEKDFTFRSFGRPEFEEMLSAYLKQFPEMVNGCLGNAVQNMRLDSSQDVDLVVLTGGHSQWYFADDMIMGKNKTYGTIDLPKIRNNPNRVIRLASPQKTVGCGMVYQGLMVKGDEIDQSLKSVITVDAKWEMELATKPKVERIIGIDFGTSTSLIKVKTYKAGEPLGSREATEYIPFSSRSADSTSPTLVLESDDGEYRCGYDAEYANVTGKMCRNFKLDLASDDAEKRAKAQELTEQFFTYLYRAYDSQTHTFSPCDEETTYVSYPAKWPKEARKFMIEAASKAGFKNVKGIDEPSAAIHTVIVQETKKLKSIGLLNGEDFNILIIDMGAGTTDLALCRYTAHSNSIYPLFSWPQDTCHSLFGGREIDDMLQKYLLQAVADQGITLPVKKQNTLLKGSKEWKEVNVSPVLAKDEPVKYCAQIENYVDDFILTSFRRLKFEEMLSDYLRQFPQMVNDCLGNAVQSQILSSRQDVDLVVLTGGHSQWYFAEDMIMGKNRTYGTIDLPKVRNNRNRVIRLASPQETVGYGMVYQPLTVNPDKIGGKQEAQTNEQPEWEFAAQTSAEEQLIEQESSQTDSSGLDAKVILAKMNDSEFKTIVISHAFGAAAAGMAAGWIPGAGSTIALTTALGFILSMYARMSHYLGIKFSKNKLRVLGTGAVSYLSLVALNLAAGTALSFVPGVGSVAASVLAGSASYANITVSAIIFKKVIAGTIRGDKDISTLSDDELKNAVKNSMSKEEIKKAYTNALADFKALKKSGAFDRADKAVMMDEFKDESFR